MGSTETFFHDFFPAAAAALKQHRPLWDVLQPPWLAEACPEQQLAVPLPSWLGGMLWQGTGAALLVRNPSLLPAQLAGLAVALFGVCRLRSPRHVYLHHSLLLFGLMNARWVLGRATRRGLGRKACRLLHRVVGAQHPGSRRAPWLLLHSVGTWPSCRLPDPLVVLATA